MANSREYLTDSTTFLKNKISQVKEYFIKYYGEDKREEIEKKFNSINLYCYFTPEVMKELPSRLSKEQDTLEQEKLLSKLDVPYSKEDLFSYYSYEYKNLYNIEKLSRLFELNQLGEEGRKKEFIDEGIDYIKDILPNVPEERIRQIKSSSEITNLRMYQKNNIDYYLDYSNSEKEYKKLFEELKSIIEKVKPNCKIEELNEFFNENIIELLNRYTTYKNNIDTYRSENKEFERNANKIKETIKLLNEKYSLKLIKENINLLPKDESVMKYLQEGGTKPGILTQIFGLNVNSENWLMYFSDEYDELIEQQDAKGNTAKYMRVSYFKALGINLGDNYEDYIKDEEVQKQWPKKKYIDKFIESRNKIQYEYNKELFESIEEYKTHKEELEQIGFLDKNVAYNPNLLSKKLTCVSPNVILDDDGYKLYSEILICLDYYNENYIDHNIIHELNHLYELTLTKINDKGYSFVTGWDSSEELFEETEEENTEQRREYELISEAINEMISQEIIELMRQDKFTIFDDYEKQVYKHTTSYEELFVLLRPFYENNKEIIKQSRIDNNMNLLIETIGKENLSKINRIVKEYYCNCTGFNFFNIRNDIKNNKDTQRRRLYESLLEQNREVLNEIEEYKNTKLNTK